MPIWKRFNKWYDDSNKLYIRGNCLDNMNPNIRKNVLCKKLLIFMHLMVNWSCTTKFSKQLNQKRCSTSSMKIICLKNYVEIGGWLKMVSTQKSSNLIIFVDCSDLQMKDMAIDVVDGFLSCCFHFLDKKDFK